MSTRTLFLKPGAAAGLKFHIGIDGGGTGTRARLSTAAGQMLGFGQAGPSGLGQGIDKAWANVNAAIAAAFAQASFSPAPLAECALGLGMAGAHVSSRVDAFMAAAPGFALVCLDTDAYGALLGAHHGKPGALLASGTGSIGEALHADGRRCYVGGFGFKIGDEGSGGWLGLEAIRVATHAEDGRQPVGALARAVWAVTGSGREAMSAWCENAGQHEFAQLAPLVFDTEESDPVAAQLLARALGDLEAVVTALDPEGELPLSLSGSICLRLAPRFSGIIRDRCIEPAGDCADGALRLIEKALSQIAS